MHTVSSILRVLRTLTVAGLALHAMLLSGCSVRQLTFRDATWINPAQLQELIETEPALVIIDVRDDATSGIPGAIKIELGKICRRIPQLKEGDPVVIYADAETEYIAMAAAEKILKYYSHAISGTDWTSLDPLLHETHRSPSRGPVGYFNIKNVMILEDGLTAWMADGGLTEPLPD